MHKKTAFTLVELMVSMTIIGILSSIAVIGLSSIRQRASNNPPRAACRTDVQ